MEREQGKRITQDQRREDNKKIAQANYDRICLKAKCVYDADIVMAKLKYERKLDKAKDRLNLAINPLDYPKHRYSDGKYI